MPSIREPRRLVYLLSVLSLLGLGLGVVYWPRPPTLVAPAAMTAAEVAATPDAVLVGRVGHDLAWRLVAPREDPAAWRRFAEPARHIFLLTRFDEALRQGDLEAIRAGAAEDALAPQPADIAAASTAVGAPRLAAACTNLATMAPPKVGNDPYATIRRDIRAALASEDPVNPCTRCIRAHAAEMLAP